MDKIIRVLIADPDPDFGQSLAENIRAQADMQVLALVGDGLKALELAKSHAPDVLVTDLMLRGMEGLCLMNSLRQQNRLPHTIVVSGFINSRLVEKVGRHGAEFFFLKPCRIQSLLDSIRECMDSETQPERRAVERLADEILRDCGIPSRLSGYTFLRESAVLLGLHRVTLQGITKILYPELAKLYNVKQVDVERCIRHAIKQAWANTEGLKKSFADNEKYPTNREFLAYLVRRLEMEFAEDDKIAL